MGRVRVAVNAVALGLEEYLDVLDERDGAALLPVTPWRASCRRVLRRVSGC